MQVLAGKGTYKHTYILHTHALSFIVELYNYAHIILRMNITTLRPKIPIHFCKTSFNLIRAKSHKSALTKDMPQTTVCSCLHQLGLKSTVFSAPKNIFS